jgi:hypothetical protein
MTRPTLCAAAVLIAIAGTASAQTLSSIDFEDGLTHGWTVNGSTDVVATDGNPAHHLHLPYGDFMWVDFRTQEPGPLTGNLARHGGPLRATVDIRTFNLQNFFGEPMDPQWFPVTIQFVDAADPTVSVYYTGPAMPPVLSNWVGFTFNVPDPTQVALPPGWGGTGDEDPVTFEPRLPANRTYASVMTNVGSVHITTAEPGYFYASSFWEVGYDNLVISRVQGQACYSNCDASTASPVLNVADFTCFLQKYAAGEAYANCDGSTAAPVLNVADFTCFLQSYAAGCP